MMLKNLPKSDFRQNEEYRLERGETVIAKRAREDTRRLARAKPHELR